MRSVQYRVNMTIVSLAKIPGIVKYLEYLKDVRRKKATCASEQV